MVFVRRKDIRAERGPEPPSRLGPARRRDCRNAVPLNSNAIARYLIRLIVRIDGEQINDVSSFVDGEHCPIGYAVVVSEIGGPCIFERALLLRILLRVGL